MYNGNMAKSASNAFTLVELLVVIAIMGVIGVFTLANYRSFGEDRNLKNASLDIQNLLRQAQTNASANAKCNTVFNAKWLVEFADNKTINLKCSLATNSIKSLPLGANIEIQSASCGLPFTTSFDPVSGKVGLGTCTSPLTVTLTNSKTGSIKSFKIEKGGRIYEQP